MTASRPVNDALGHAAGDDVLRAVATQLRLHTREDDLVCRLGGDEFAVLVHDLDAAGQAEAVAGRLVDAVRSASVPGVELPIGACAGVRRIDGSSTDLLLADADTALYAAKRAGGGSVVLWRGALREVGRSVPTLAEVVPVPASAPWPRLGRRARRGDGDVG